MKAYEANGQTLANHKQKFLLEDHGASPRSLTSIRSTYFFSFSNLSLLSDQQSPLIHIISARAWNLPNFPAERHF
jgi:hypothetical protein